MTNSVVAVDGVDTSVFDTGFMGSKGVVSSLISAFIIVNVYKFCILHNVTIRMPKEVPGTIAQSFRDIFAFGFSIIICAAIDFVCRATIATPFANLVSTLMSPLFSPPSTLMPAWRSSPALSRFSSSWASTARPSS